MPRRAEIDDDDAGMEGGVDCRGLDGRVVKGVGTLRCPGCGVRAAVLYVTPTGLPRCGSCLRPNLRLAGTEAAG